MNEEHWLHKQAESKLQIALTEKQLKQFTQYFNLLIETNRNINLTSITEPHEVYGKHFYDSLTLSSVVLLTKLKSVIDIGSGAGFPGIPLKIAFPHLHVVLIDSLKKRVAFLENVTRHLGLKQVTCVHGRAEDLGHQADFRQQFDLVTARAVAKLNILAEYCLPFAKVNGYFVAMKGSDVQEEIDHAKQAFRHLGQASPTLFHFSLPDQLGERHIIKIQKKRSTPHLYPRRAGIPKQQPL